MTDLSEMRRIAKQRDDLRRNRHDREEAYEQMFDPPTVLALLDVVEAATPFMDHPDHTSDEVKQEQRRALSSALSRLESL